MIRSNDAQPTAGVAAGKHWLPALLTIQGARGVRTARSKIALACCWLASMLQDVQLLIDSDLRKKAEMTM